MLSAAPLSLSAQACDAQAYPPIHAARRKAVMLGGGLSTLDEITGQLSDNGFGVRPFGTPHEFFRELHSFSPSLVLACAPFADEVPSAPVIRRIRELFGRSAPIMVICQTANHSLQLDALEAGADDFVGHDTPPNIVMARIKALLRRYSEDEPDMGRLTVGDYTIDFGSQAVQVGGRHVSLTPKEFDLFWVFAGNVGRLISKRELLTCVWGQNCELDTHTLSQHVHALRRKLRLSENSLQITALYGAGYRLERLGGEAASRYAHRLDPAEPSR